MLFEDTRMRHPPHLFCHAEFFKPNRYERRKFYHDADCFLHSCALVYGAIYELGPSERRDVALIAGRKRRSSAQTGVLQSRLDEPDEPPDTEPPDTEPPDVEPPVVELPDTEPPDVEPFYEPDFDPESPPDEIEEIIAQPRDSFVDLAKEDVKKLFSKESESVFYQRQLQVIFEKEYFHWVTVRALSELVQEEILAAEVLPLPGTGTITIYRSIGYRYWKRDADEIVKLVSRFSDSAFTSALGAHGETMFDAALPTVGFMPTGWKVRSYGAAGWTETGHDLDRVFERDGIAYGTEIKNTLSYIEKNELEIKIKMCKHLGLRPLFIVRMAPKSYVNLVAEEGGFTLIFKYQLYPFGQKAFADEVKARLRLPTDSPKRIEHGTGKRLLDWHLKKLKAGR
jgi:hypothetical protein